MRDAQRQAQEIIRHHSKSFSLASRLLPPHAQDHAVAVYAWCRRADDAIDLVEPAEQPQALVALRRELDDVYGSVRLEDPVLSLFQATVAERGVPRRYAEDLLRGMEMDVAGRSYDTMDDLFDYCYHVAGCVGLMMCHVMGLAHDSALANAAHLGMAMQLTNICRDVAEDWERERLYIPDALLVRHGVTGLSGALGSAFPDEARGAVAAATADLLAEADRFYVSGDAGLPALSWRCAVAIRTARAVYSSIGDRIQAQGCDPLEGRAFVSSGGKVRMAVGAVLASSTDLPRRLVHSGRDTSRPPTRIVVFPDDVLPIGTKGVAA